jgi:hypothetical protein
MTSTPETPEAESTPEPEAEPTPEAEPENAPDSENAPPEAEPTPIDEAVARELALAALAEVTPATTIGEFADSTTADDGVLTLRFENRMPGYPGWFWTVGIAQVADSAPTVLEVELLPSDTALVAPDWLPWTERLAEYQAAQAALAAEGLETDAPASSGADDDDDDDLDDLDASDFDMDGSPILHSGDVDGVDIDELADDEDFEDEDDEDVDDEDEDEDLNEDEDLDDESVEDAGASGA